MWAQIQMQVSIIQTMALIIITIVGMVQVFIMEPITQITLPIIRGKDGTTMVDLIIGAIGIMMAIITDTIMEAADIMEADIIINSR